MKPSGHLRTKLVTLALGFLGTLAASLGFYAGVYEQLGLERLAVDLRFRLFDTGIRDSGQIAIVAIDDGSLASVGDWPWPRTHLAKIIDLLDALESREILIDLVFSMPRPADPTAEISEDESLAQACRRQDRVLLSAYFAEHPNTPQAFDLLLSDFKLSPDELAEKTGIPLDHIRSNFISTRRLAARKLVKDRMVGQPASTRQDVGHKILGEDWISLPEQRREIERAYDYIQSYLHLRNKAGCRIESDEYRPPIHDMNDRMQMVLPITRLARSGRDLGFVNFDRDPDGKIRKVALLTLHDNRIYRQLALAGLCQALQIEPSNILIGTRSITLVDQPVDNRDAFILQSNQPGQIHIPLTADGRMLINWYAPENDRWQTSFQNMLPAALLLEIASKRENLAHNRLLLADAMEITIREFLPDQHDRYIKLIRRMPMLLEGVDETLIETADQEAILDESAFPASLQESTGETAPTTTIEQDLVSAYHQTRSEIDRIETEAFEQLGWLYEQLTDLPTDQQITSENNLIHSLWRCLNSPDQVRQINARLETDLIEKIAMITPIVRDKIVFIGYTASTLADFVSTPVFDQCPGVLVHANILNQILQRSFLSQSDRNSDLLVILVIGTLVTLLTAQRSAFEGLAWMIVLLAAFVLFTGFVVFAKLHIVSSMVGPIVAIVLSWSLVSFYRQITEARTRRLFVGRLSQYTSPALAKRIADQPEHLEIQPEQREVTCFFSDLAGFTPLSEKLGPEQTVHLLNLYLDHMTEVLDRRQAFINKFQGDGIFAFFNPPLNPQDDHAQLACLAAIETQQALPHIQEHLTEVGIPLEHPLTMRIGISTGQVFVGDCGSARKFDYTCLGDTVNRAARMESANKFFGTRIMICEQTHQQIDEDFLTRLLGKVQLVGKEKPLVVYELIGLAEDHSDKSDYAQLFEKMVRAYWAKDFHQTRDLLEQIETINPDDRTGAIYRKLLEQDRRDFRGGVIEMEIK